jgi:ATP synthase I chain
VSVSTPLKRLERDTAIIVVAAAGVAFLLRPDMPRFALGVVGGGVLIGLSYWALRGVADALAEGAIQREFRRNSRSWLLVKFFTRHAILALTAYGMMARLELHPVGLLMGVAAPVVAFALEAVREARR